VVVVVAAAAAAVGIQREEMEGKKATTTCYVCMYFSNTRVM
jgi:hypothetical protein